MAFEKIKKFFVRHKNKFIFGGIVVGASVFLTNYGKKRIKEWQEVETREFLERAKKSQHFESTEKTCNQTIQNLSLSLVDAVQRALDTENCVIQLQNSNKSNDRIKVWDDFKTLIFSKLCTLVYACSMLTVTLRIQLNLIGGYLYKDAQKIDGATQKMYLSLIEEFLENGVEKLSILIHSKTVEVLRPIDLKKQLSLYDIEQIFWAIQAKLCEGQNDPTHTIKNYIFPQEVNINSINIYDNMVKETVDLLESEEVSSIITSLINCGFSLAIDKLTDFYTPAALPTTSSNQTENFIHPSKIKIHLVKLIPILNTFFTNKNLCDTLLQNHIFDSKLKMLGANVYEAFSH